MLKINKIMFLIFLLFSHLAYNKSLRKLLISGKYPQVKDGVLDLSKQHLRNLTGIEHYPNIENVNNLIVSDNNLKSLDGLIGLKNPTLKILDASGNKISNLKGLEKFKYLEEVYLESNLLTSDDLKILKSLRTVIKIIVDNNPTITDRVYKYNYEICGRRNLNYLEMFPFILKYYFYEIENDDDPLIAFDYLDVHKVEDFVCPICHEDKTDELIATKCLHIFHGNCLDEWLQHETANFDNRTTCPLCKQDLNE